MRTLKQLVLEALAGLSSNDRLHDKFWDSDEKFDSRTRKKLIELAELFYKSSKLKAKILDIQLTGSLANYNYHDNSDLDVHIIIDFAEVNKDKDIVAALVNAIKWKWHKNHNISIHGTDVELYIQDKDALHVASGLYSLLHDKWIIKPKKKKTAKVDKKEVMKVADVFKKAFKDLIDRSETANNGDEVKEIIADSKELRRQIARLRKDSFEKGNDEFSVANLAFKELRNSGTIKGLIELENGLIDVVYSESKS